MLPPRHQRAAKRAFWSYWPRRFLGDRGILAVLVILAVVLMGVSHFAPQTAARTRAGVFDQLSGTLTFLSVPAKKAATFFEHLAGLSDMSSDVAALRQENAKLKQWYDRALALEAENRSLRRLVHLADLPQASAVTARVIATSGGSFAQSIIVDAGQNQQVGTNAVAMTGDGVVGRALTISDHTSQVLLLTDVNSRIPVVIENSRHRGILAGDNSQHPLLMYLPDDASISVGERVVTSGDAVGVFAPGLPVGIVVSVQANAVRVQPFADLRRIDFVQLIDFGRKKQGHSHYMPPALRSLAGIPNGKAPFVATPAPAGDTSLAQRSAALLETPQATQ